MLTAVWLLITYEKCKLETLFLLIVCFTLLAKASWKAKSSSLKLFVLKLEEPRAIVVVEIFVAHNLSAC